MEDIVQALITLALLLGNPVVGGGCPDNPRGETITLPGRCLEFINKEVLYPKAQEMCRERDGYVITIENKEEQQMLEKSVKELLGMDKNNAGTPSVFWLGITRRFEETNDGSRRQIWYKDNGEKDAEKDEVTPINYTNWDTEEPDWNRDRNCAAFGYWTDFKWQADLCNCQRCTYLVICQYDEPATRVPKLALLLTVIGLIILFAAIGFGLSYKCYSRRRELENHLHSEHSEESIYSAHEYHITNTDPDANGEQKFCTDNNLTPNAYAPVANITSSGESYHDFNILHDTGHIQDKLQYKDLSLGNVYSQSLLPGENVEFSPTDYRRSISATSSCPPPYPSAPSETSSINIDDIELGNRADETLPLHINRTESVTSNNLNV